MAGESGSRMSVSEETLRRLFAEFESKVVQKLTEYATKAAHDALEGRVKSLELWQAAQTGASSARQGMSRAAITWAGLAVAALSALATVVWLQHG